MARKRMLFLALACAFLLAFPLAGCTSQPSVTQQGQSSATPAPTTEATPAPTATEPEENFNATGYPVVKEKMIFTVFLPGSEMDFNEKSAWMDVSTKTNVYIEWDNPTWEATAERLQLIFASGDYPDAIGGWTLSSADVAKYGPMGVFLPLQDWIEQYTVNIRQSFLDVPDAKTQLTLPDGNIYTLPIIGKQPPTRATTSINQVWLERIGKEMPKTTAELLEVLRLFKTEDPNQNGKADEIPMTFDYNGTNNNDNFGLFGWFGYIDMSNHMLQKDGKVLWAPEQQGWKDAIKFFAQLWEEGLLDQEIFTHDIPQYDAKVRQDPPVVGVYSSSNIIDPPERKEYVFLPPPDTGNGNKAAWPDGDPWVFREQCAITTAANEDGKDGRALLRYIDEIYLNGTLDGSGLNPLFHGPEGVGWEKTPEGIKMLDPAKTDPDWQKKFGMPYGFPWYEPLKTTDAKFKDEGTILKYNTSAEIWGPYQGQQLPPMWFSETQQSEASAYLADLQKLTEEKVASWISGKGDIDAEYDQYIADCKTMGLEKLLAIYQELLDAYNAAK